MNIILAIISIFVFAVGALTFRSSSEEAAETHDYESLLMSSVMVCVGVFCTAFFLADIATAAVLAAVSIAVMFVVHTIISRMSCASSKNASKTSEPKHSKIAGAKHAEIEE